MPTYGERHVSNAELDQRLAHLPTKADLSALEARLQRTIITVMVGMTGIFAFFVGVMTWVLSRRLP